MQSIMFKRIVFVFFLFASINIISAEGANETMIVEANILGFANVTEIPEVSIEVPDYIFLGNVTRDEPVSDNKRIDINNTGKVNITVTPQLKDPDEEIFSYLFFRTRQSSSNPELNTLYRIGEYSLNIDKPRIGIGKEYCYIKLDLTDFNGRIDEDLFGYKADIIFLAMPR